MTPKEEFIEIYTKYITRNGAEELLEWLKRTDFFTAPASTKYHCACEGGLVMHSVSVFNTMMEKHYDEETDNIESFAICGLLHDLCKAQFYKVSSRNVKTSRLAYGKKCLIMQLTTNSRTVTAKNRFFLLSAKCT